MLVFEEKGKTEYPAKDIGARAKTNTAWCFRIDLLQSRDPGVRYSKLEELGTYIPSPFRQIK